VVLFPEAFISAYPRRASFGAVIGARSLSGGRNSGFITRLRSTCPDPASTRLVRLQSRVHLVIGLIERDGGTLYCTVLSFGPDSVISAGIGN